MIHVHEVPACCGCMWHVRWRLHGMSAQWSRRWLAGEGGGVVGSGGGPCVDRVSVPRIRCSAWCCSHQACAWMSGHKQHPTRRAVQRQRDPAGTGGSAAAAAAATAAAAAQQRQRQRQWQSSGRAAAAAAAAAKATAAAAAAALPHLAGALALCATAGRSHLEAATDVAQHDVAVQLHLGYDLRRSCFGIGQREGLQHSDAAVGHRLSVCHLSIVHMQACAAQMGRASQ
jgi:hypothetical protein